MAAFEQLVDKYKQPVIHLLFRSLHDLTEAEDIAQNVFLQVYKNASRYEPRAKFSTWLFTIARNLGLNELRRRARHPADSMDAYAEGNDEHAATQFEDRSILSPTTEVLQHELEEKLEEALKELPESQRTALLLCREEDLSYEDIGKILGCSLSATKSLIHRGRETLKQKLRPYLKSNQGP
jgi:RNA polymerase sigma-70 factor (ECF subfamily)